MIRAGEEEMATARGPVGCPPEVLITPTEVGMSPSAASCRVHCTVVCSAHFLIDESWTTEEAPAVFVSNRKGPRPRLGVQGNHALESLALSRWGQPGTRTVRVVVD